LGLLRRRLGRGCLPNLWRFLTGIRGKRGSIGSQLALQSVHTACEIEHDRP